MATVGDLNPMDSNSGYPKWPVPSHRPFGGWKFPIGYNPRNRKTRKKILAWSFPELTCFVRNEADEGKRRVRHGRLVATVAPACSIRSVHPGRARFRCTVLADIQEGGLFTCVEPSDAGPDRGNYCVVRCGVLRLARAQAPAAGAGLDSACIMILARR